MIWYIFAFLYFILVDVLIFTQQWTLLIVALISGGLFVAIALILRALFPHKPRENATAQVPPAQPPQSQAYPQSSAPYWQPQQGQAVPVEPQVIAPGTRFAASAPAAEAQPDVNIPAVFFFTELMVVLGLVVFLFVR